jgi:hypothetical protein
VKENHGDGDFWVVKLSDGGSLLWQKTFGGSGYDSANSVRQTSDGGYVIAGCSDSDDGDGDVLVVKLSEAGSILWQNRSGGRGPDGAESVRQTSDGGYIIAGYTNSGDDDVTGNRRKYDFLVVKLSEGGSLQWNKSFGGKGGDFADSIQQTSDGGYIIAGRSDSNDGDVTGNHGRNDFWVVKISEGGSLQWQKTFGGSGNDEAESIWQTSDGGYIVAGSSESNDGDVTGTHGDGDYWAVKLTDGGSIQWQKTFGGGDVDVAKSVRQTSDGGYVIAGYSKSNDGDVTGNHGSSDFWVVKLQP